MQAYIHTYIRNRIEECPLWNGLKKKKTTQTIGVLLIHKEWPKILV